MWAGFGSNAAWFAAGYTARTLFVAANFLLAAHFLGAEAYGAFVALTVLGSAMGLLAGLGAENLLLRDLARDPQCMNAAWSRVLVWTVLTAFVSLPAMALVARLLLEGTVPSLVVMAVALSELFFVRFVNSAGLIFQARQQLRITATLHAALAGFRLAFAAGVVLFLESTLLAWSVAHLIATAATAVGALVFVTARFRFRFCSDWLTRDVGTGTLFFLSLTGQRIYTDIEKALLASRGSLESAGIYSAASRVADLAVVPVLALQAAVSARLFEAGSKGLGAVLRLVPALVPPALIAAGAASLALFLAAPWVPLLLGEDFVGVVSALRWLAVLPLLRTLSLFAMQLLTAADYQRARVLLEWSAVATTIGLNLALIPVLDWRGAAIAVVTTYGALAMAGWGCIVVLARREAAESRSVASVT